MLGLQCVYMGILSQVFFDYSGEDDREVVPALSVHAHRRAVGAAVRRGRRARRRAHHGRTSRNGFRLLEGQPINHLGVIGLLFGISGFMTFTFTLLLHAIPVAVRRKS